MAQLKNTIVTGNLQVTEKTISGAIKTPKVEAPTTSGGSSYGAGTSGQVLTTNGTSVYWGTLPAGVSPSSTTPIMDGTATVGTETAFARGDHVHPTDTTRAPLASPALTGTPTAPTATAGTNTTQVATTAFVTTAVANKAVPSATTTTPKMDGTAAVGSETTWAKGDHVHPTDTTRAPLASPALTGTPTAPTATAGTSTTQIATTAFVGTAITNAKPTTTTATVTTSAWSNLTATVNVTGVTASNTVIVAPAPASREVAVKAQMYCSAQGAGTLTFTCKTVPTASVTVNVMIFG